MDTTNSYDRVPYKSYPFRLSHPERLSTLATLFGMRPAPIDHCRVLELGCASGGNLLPLAEQFPDSRFVGIDSSRRQVEMASEALVALELANVELRHSDLRDVGADLGQFDYIIAHGVYSWVPADVQDKLLAICNECLAAEGVAFVSYNTFPGWHMRRMIRDMMLYRARHFDDPAEQIRQARVLIDFLAQTVPAEGNAYGILLSQELNVLRQTDDSYQLHEHLEEVNEPTYFYQFVERAEAKGLQYLVEADLNVTASTNLPPQIESGMRSFSSNLIEMEQYMDFVLNRTFRQTLVCHRAVAIDRLPAPGRVHDMHVASSAQPANAAVDIHSDTETTYRTAGAFLTSNDPLVKAAMQRLQEDWPRAVPFAELLAAARARLAAPSRAAAGIAPEADESDEGDLARRLADPLMRCFTTSLVELSVYPSTFTVRVSDQPLASKTARWQALRSDAVTNRRHDSLRLSEFHRRTLQFLDGRHDRAGLLAELTALVSSGTLLIHEYGQRVEHAERVRGALEEAIDLALPQLARNAFLTG